MLPGDPAAGDAGAAAAAAKDASPEPCVVKPKEDLIEMLDRQELQEENGEATQERRRSLHGMTEVEEEQVINQMVETLKAKHMAEEQARVSINEKINREMEAARWTGLTGELAQDKALPFSVFIIICILANAVSTAVFIDYDLGEHAEIIITSVFTAIWVIEVIVNMFVYGPRKYFSSYLRRMDLALAMLSVLSTWILPAILGESFNGGIVAVLRMARLMGLIRVVKVLKQFNELWVLIVGLVSSIAVLSWTMVLLVAVLFIMAMLFTLAIGQDCEDTFADWSDCYTLYGTVPRTMFTLFQMSTLESWAMVVARPVLEKRPYMIVPIVGYIFLTTFGFFNIIVGTMVEKTLQATSENKEDVEKQRLLRQIEELKELKRVFVRGDTDKSGTVTVEEFVKVCRQPDVQASFALLDLNVKRPMLAQRLFEVLDSGRQGSMHCDELLERAWFLVIEGRALKNDMSLLLMENRHLSRRVQKVQDALGITHLHGHKQAKPMDGKNLDDADVQLLLLQKLGALESHMLEQTLCMKDVVKRLGALESACDRGAATANV